MEFGVQRRLLPQAQVADMGIAVDALNLLG